MWMLGFLRTVRAIRAIGAIWCQFWLARFSWASAWAVARCSLRYTWLSRLIIIYLSAWSWWIFGTWSFSRFLFWTWWFFKNSIFWIRTILLCRNHLINLSWINGLVELLFRMTWNPWRLKRRPTDLAFKPSRIHRRCLRFDILRIIRFSIIVISHSVFLCVINNTLFRVSMQINLFSLVLTLISLFQFHLFNLSL